jgi:hypothetical protein
MKNTLLLLVFSMNAAAQEKTTVVVHPLEFKKSPLDFTKKSADALQSEFERITRKTGVKLCEVPKDGKTDPSLTT